MGDAGARTLVIRDEQMQVFKRLPLARFENQLVRHFFRYYPRECRLLGRQQVLAWVRLGIEKAVGRGFDAQRETAAYLGVMFILGSRFDADPQFPWVAECLEGAPWDRSWERVRELHAATVRFLEATVGDANRTLVKALVRMRDLDPAAGCEGVADDGVEAHVGAVLARLYPERCAYQGDAALSALVRLGVERSRRHGISDLPGTTLIVILMFMLGSGFDDDPLYPWAARALADPAAGDGAAKARRLHGEALAHLAQSLADG